MERLPQAPWPYGVPTWRITPKPMKNEGFYFLENMDYHFITAKNEGLGWGSHGNGDMHVCMFGSLEGYFKLYFEKKMPSAWRMGSQWM